MNISNNKNKGVLIAIFLGEFGGYRFYRHQYSLGIIYFFTCGLFFFGWFYDIYAALTYNCNKFSSNGNSTLMDSTYTRTIESFSYHGKKYDFDSLDGIKAITIPVDDEGYDEPVYYILQRKATEHKKNKNMELAIACLRKSNEISDSMNKPVLCEQDYLRLVKYIEKTGDMTLAKQEEQAIYQRHPEFNDKRISNKKNIQMQLKKMKEWKEDLVIVETNKTCSICKSYNKKIYSISGNNKNFPKLPNKILNDGGFCPKCSCILLVYFEGISSKKY